MKLKLVKLNSKIDIKDYIIKIDSVKINSQIIIYETEMISNFLGYKYLEYTDKYFELLNKSVSNIEYEEIDFEFYIGDLVYYNLNEKVVSSKIRIIYVNSVEDYENDISDDYVSKNSILYYMEDGNMLYSDNVFKSKSNCLRSMLKEKIDNI